MSKLTKKALLKHLDKSDKEDIIREVVILFDKFKNVKEFYQAELLNDNSPVLDTYKKKIAEAYAKLNPKERTTNANLNKLITAFKKVKVYDRDLAELMLYRVECGVQAIKKNPKRTPTFYNCILTTFEDAIKLIVADGNVSEFQDRVEKAMKASEAGKYQMRESMADIYNRYL